MKKTKFDASSYLKDFLKKNWFILWGVLLLSAIINIFIYMNFKDATSKLNKAINKEQKMVIMLSPSGNIIPVKKTYLSYYSKPYQNVLSKILINGLIIDGEKATFGGQQLPSAKQLVYGNQDIKIFFKYYLTHNAKIEYVKYLRTILALINQQNYPDTISVINYSVKSYQVRNHEFSISISANVVATFINPVTYKITKEQATINISAQGYFDPSKSNEYNPFGIIFKHIQATILKGNL